MVLDRIPTVYKEVPVVLDRVPTVYTKFISGLGVITTCICKLFGVPTVLPDGHLPFGASLHGFD